MCFPLVEIGLTDLPKIGGVEAPPAPFLRQPWLVLTYGDAALFVMCSTIWVQVFDIFFNSNFEIYNKCRGELRSRELGQMKNWLLFVLLQVSGPSQGLKIWGGARNTGWG